MTSGSNRALTCPKLRVRSSVSASQELAAIAVAGAEPAALLAGEAGTARLRLARERLAAHQRIAAAIGRRQCSMPGQPLEELARHWYEAGNRETVLFYRDSRIVVEETTTRCFPSNLFSPPADLPAIVRENPGGEMCRMSRDVGVCAAGEPVYTVLRRIIRFDPGWIHPMHGGSRPEEIRQSTSTFVIPSRLPARASSSGNAAWPGAQPALL